MATNLSDLNSYQNEMFRRQTSKEILHETFSTSEILYKNELDTKI